MGIRVLCMKRHFQCLQRVRNLLNCERESFLSFVHRAASVSEETGDKPSWILRNRLYICSPTHSYAPTHAHLRFIRIDFRLPEPPCQKLPFATGLLSQRIRICKLGWRFQRIGTSWRRFTVNACFMLYCNIALVSLFRCRRAGIFGWSLLVCLELLRERSCSCTQWCY